MTIDAEFPLGMGKMAFECTTVEGNTNNEGKPAMVAVTEDGVEVTGRDAQGDAIGEPLLVRAGKSTRVVRGEQPTLLNP